MNKLFKTIIKKSMLLFGGNNLIPSIAFFEKVPRYSD
jgi:hypothetical protein